MSPHVFIWLHSKAFLSISISILNMVSLKKKKKTIMKVGAAISGGMFDLKGTIWRSCCGWPSYKVIKKWTNGDADNLNKEQFDFFKIKISYSWRHTTHEQIFSISFLPSPNQFEVLLIGWKGKQILLIFWKSKVLLYIKNNSVTRTCRVTFFLFFFLRFLFVSCVW